MQYLIMLIINEIILIEYFLPKNSSCSDYVLINCKKSFDKRFFSSGQTYIYYYYYYTERSNENLSPSNSETEGTSIISKNTSIFISTVTNFDMKIIHKISPFYGQQLLIFFSVLWGVEWYYIWQVFCISITSLFFRYGIKYWTCYCKKKTENVLSLLVSKKGHKWEQNHRIKLTESDRGSFDNTLHYRELFPFIIQDVQG